MSGFWIVGIAINLIALGALVIWAVKAWKASGSARHDRDAHDGDTRR